MFLLNYSRLPRMPDAHSILTNTNLLFMPQNVDLNAIPEEWSLTVHHERGLWTVVLAMHRQPKPVQLRAQHAEIHVLMQGMMQDIRQKFPDLWRDWSRRAEERKQLAQRFGASGAKPNGIITP